MLSPEPMGTILNSASISPPFSRSWQVAEKALISNLRLKLDPVYCRAALRTLGVDDDVVFHHESAPFYEHGAAIPAIGRLALVARDIAGVPIPEPLFEADLP